MTAVPLFGEHKGRHQAPPGRVTLFFRHTAALLRRAVAALRMLRRKRSVPALPGAGTAVPSGDRYACCAHCLNGCPCDPRDNHPTPCDFGCNDAVPVLGDRMLSDVRREYDGLAGMESTAPKSPMRPTHYDRRDGEIVVTTQNAVAVLPDDPMAQPPWLPTPEEMRAEYFASPACPWLPAQQPAWPALPEPERADDTTSDLSPARYVPDVPDTCCPAETERPVYGQVSVATILAAEQAEQMPQVIA